MKLPIHGRIIAGQTTDKGKQFTVETSDANAEITIGEQVSTVSTLSKNEDSLRDLRYYLKSHLTYELKPTAYTSERRLQVEKGIRAINELLGDEGS